MKSPWMAIALLCSLVGCAHDPFEPAPAPEPVELPVPSLDIATLRGLYPGHSVAVSLPDVVVEGYVNTSDRAGNFYRSFLIEDATGAVEIRAGLYDLHNLYRPGRRIVVAATGLTLGMEDGVLQLGLASAAYPTGYMEHRVVVERYVFPGEELVPVVPRETTIRALRPEWCGTLVSLRGLALAVDADTTWALPGSATATGIPRSAQIKLRTAPDDSIYVFTSGYANFAGERVPRGRFALQGILMRGPVGGRDVYQLKLRDLDDVRQGD